MNDVVLLLAVLAVMCGASGLAYWRIARWQQPHIPAAPDNQPGTDADLLTACRRIANPTTRKETP